MEKLSEEKIAAVMTEVPGVLRKLAGERDSWRERALAAEGHLEKQAHQARIMKIAQIMEDKGLDGGRTMEERVEALEKKASEGRLDAVEEAIGMVPQSVDMGDLVDVPTGAGASDLEQYLLGDLA